MKPLVLVVGVLLGSACSEQPADLGSTEQHIDPPMMVTATPFSATRIDVNWESVPGAFKYYVEQSTAGGPFVYVNSVLEPLPTPAHIAQNLAPATTYSYRITAVHTDGSESLPSAPVSATTPSAGSGAPTNVTATAISPSQIDVTWTTVTNAFKYYVFQSTAGGPFVYVNTVLHPGSTHNASGLAANTEYCYVLRTSFTDGTESGDSSPPACATTAGGAQPPATVTATPISEDRITVAWSAVTGAAKYYVYQSPPGGSPTFIGTALSPTTNFLVANLMPSTTYCFQVQTELTDGSQSALSQPPRCATTFDPGGGLFEGWYKLDERSGSTAVDSSGFFRHGSIANASYSLMDKPQIDDNLSALAFTTSTGSVVTMPAAPGFNLTGSFTVAFWVKVPGGNPTKFIGMRAAGCGALGWEIAQDGTNGLHFAGENETVPFGVGLTANEWTHVAVTHAAGTMTTYINGAQTNTGSYTSTNSVNGSLQLGHVAGCAGDAFLMDEVQIYSRALTAADVADLGTLPPAPTNLAVTSKTSVSMTLTWDPVPGATSYILSKGTAPGNETFYTHIPATPSYEVDHLTPNTTYSFTVRAVVNGLFSNASNSASDTTNGPPAAPTGVTAMVVAPDRIQVTWDAVPGAFKYYVFRSTGGGAFVHVDSVLAPNTTHLSVNLAAATTYTYYVIAEDTVQQQSAQSAQASATTP